MRDMVCLCVCVCARAAGGALGERRVLLERVEDRQGALVPHLAAAKLQRAQVPVLGSPSIRVTYRDSDG